MGLRMETKTKLTKKCTKCGEIKPLLEFYGHHLGAGARMSVCKVCYLEHQKRPEVKAYKKKYKQRVKRAAFDRIGDMRCALCGCDEMIFLTVDHADGNGAAHRKQLNGTNGRFSNHIGSWIIKATDEELAEWNLRILCYNCNCALNYHTEATVKAAAKRDIHSRLTVAYRAS